MARPLFPAFRRLPPPAVEKVRADAGAHHRRRRLLGIAREMRIARRRRDLAVSQQPGDRRQPLAAGQRPRGIRVPGIVKAHVLHPGALPQAPPHLVEIGQVRVLLLARDHPRVAVDARDAPENPFHRGRQRHPPRPGLRVADPDLPRRAVDVVPPQRRDLVLAAPGKQQQPDRRHRRRHRASRRPPPLSSAAPTRRYSSAVRNRSRRLSR